MFAGSDGAVSMKVLVIEDIPEVVAAIRMCFTMRWPDASVIATDCGADAPRLLEQGAPDIVILDLGLPDRNGLDVLREIRRFSDLPVIIVSGNDEDTVKVMGLEMGADDYVTKPFSVREVIARVKARLRVRSEAPRTPDTFEFGNVKVDLRRRVLWKEGDECHLTTHEAGTLAYLITHRGRDVSRDELLQNVWGYTAALTTRTVDNQILKLRKKIETAPADPRHILTVHGVGYRFEQ